MGRVISGCEKEDRGKRLHTRNRDRHFGNRRGFSVAVSDGLSVAFSNGISLVGGISQSIVTCPVDFYWNCPIDFQWQFPMDFHVCDFWYTVLALVSLPSPQENVQATVGRAPQEQEMFIKI